jgi:predicted DCC family thiol-disulfide oxidoreductase YuxK
MKNGWTGGQYSIVRAALGAYLAIHFASLLPYAAEVFSGRGAVPSAALSGFHGYFPNVFARLDSPSAVVAGLLLGVALSALFALGKHDRPAALGLWYLWACLLGRNPLILNPSIPYVGWLFLAHALLLPPAPYGSLDALKRPDPGAGWRFPRPVFAAAWALLALSYSYSGWTKLMSPSWWDGSALSVVLSNPLMRENRFVAWLSSQPAPLLQLLTWGALAAELLFAPLALSARLRPVLWGALLSMHLSLLFLVDFADLSMGMVMFHLFTFDPDWVPAREGKAVVFIDGGCSVCHGFARFVLAEDRRGRLSIGHLGGEAMAAAAPPPGLPDSLVVLAQDRRWLTRSAAVLHVLSMLGGLWRAAASALSLVPAMLRDEVYDAFARRRRAASAAVGPCPLPPARLARRFV